ncbi:hypothetical protein RMATCC62417_02043 [Rhizopus microsporus]|nr:hypothetical protein RMATCC62417_02043 [Rhizopus microsporus]
MLRSALQKYFYAKEAISQDLNLYFVHANGEKVHLWSMEIPSYDIQLMERVALSNVLIKASVVTKVLPLNNFFWRLKRGILEAMKTINKMKQEHEDYMLSLQLGESVEKQKSLFSLVDKVIKKPERRSGMAYFSLVTLENVNYYPSYKKRLFF